MGLKNNNVAIKEGNLTRRIYPVDKLKINTTDNKDSTWVASDKANTGVLHASENGIYIASEDGYEAYSEVIVRVTKDSFEGDTSFDDWDYETPDMDLDNWDPETVEEFENDPEGFDDVFNNEDEWKDIDKPIDIKMDNPKIQDTKISGIDPITGNEIECSLDEDGYLNEELLPSYIEISQLPSKLVYKDGESILFNLVVKAYTADGNVWTGEHETGVIKTRELEFPVTVAIGGEGDGSDYYEATIDADYAWLSSYSLPLSIMHGTIRKDETNEETGVRNVQEVRSDAYCVPTGGGGESELLIYLSESPFNVIWHIETYWTDYPYETQDIDVTNLVKLVTEGGKTFYSSTFSQIAPVQQNKTDNNSYHIGTILFDGVMKKKETHQTVPVIWSRPGDGKALETSFTITVISDGSSGSGDDSAQAITYNGNRYVANDDVNAEAHYASGTVWNRNTGAIYSVRDAIATGMLIPADEGDTETSSGSDHEGGHF